MSNRARATRIILKFREDHTSFYDIQRAGTKTHRNIKRTPTLHTASTECTARCSYELSHFSAMSCPWTYVMCRPTATANLSDPRRKTSIKKFYNTSGLLLLLQTLNFLYWLKVMAFSMTSFHFPRSWTQVIQFLTLIWQMSCLTLSSHLYLGLHCDLLVRAAFFKLWSADHKWSLGSALVVLLDWTLVQKKTEK